MKKLSAIISLLALLLTTACKTDFMGYHDVNNYLGAVVVSDCDMCEEMLLLLPDGSLQSYRFRYLICKAYQPGDTLQIPPPMHRGNPEIIVRYEMVEPKNP